MGSSKFWDEIYQNEREYTQINEILLDELLEGRPSGEALDIGCGTGALTRRMKDRGYSVSGIDISNNAIQKAKEESKDIKYQCTGIEDFNTSDTFDVIIMNLVLKFIEDKPSAIHKIVGLLKSGGRLIVVTPVILDKYSSLVVARVKNIAMSEEEMAQLPKNTQVFNKSYGGQYDILQTLVIDKEFSS